MRKTKNAFFHRIHVRAWLAAAFVGGLPLISHAGYAQLAPPSGWTPGYYAPSANDASYGRVIHTPNGPTANVGGQAVRMPAAYRLASNAPRIAAAAIYLNPYVRTGVAIAAWLGVAGLVWDAVNNVWKKSTNEQYPVSDGYLYTSSNFPVQGYSLAEVCSKTAAFIGGGSVVQYDGLSCLIKRSDTGYEFWSPNTRGASSQCPSGWYVTPAGCVQTPPPKNVTQQEFEDALSPKPMPERVPQELPQPTPLPIEQPSPYINPEPGSNPQHRPRFVPTGDPVPNPNYDPNSPLSPSNHPWFQPGVRIVPSPTGAEPWRVDYQPVNRPQPTPQPLTNPENEPGTNPEDKPKEPDLCEKYPDILACAKPELDTPDGEIPKSNREVTLTEENLFGAGSCPADVYFAPHGLQEFKVWDWNQSCGYITSYLKPVLLLCCTFSAFMILVPGRTE